MDTQLELCAWVKRLADNWRGRRDSLTGDSVRDSCADELEKVAACHATPQPGEPCAVKPLEWRDHSFKDYEEHIASWGDYHITKDETCDWPYILRPFIAGQSNFQTLDEAKAAAQADYEQRIRSALVTTPQPAAGWDERAWLIEWPLSLVLPARWWHSELGWVHDANKAMRFCRREDAEAFIRANVFCAGMRATEHVFVGNPVRREAPAPAIPHGPAVKTPDFDSGNDGSNPSEVATARPDTAEARLREAVEDAIDTLESMDLHVDNPLYERLVKALSPPSGGDEAKESEGGAPMCDYTKFGNCYDVHLRCKWCPMRGKPGPSEPSPPADRREIVARIIDPHAFIIVNSKRADTQDRQAAANGKADAILAALAQSEEKKL